MKKILLPLIALAGLFTGCRFGALPGYDEFSTVFHGERTKLYCDEKFWDFADFLRQEIKDHPEMECVDLYKFCRQAAFGIHTPSPESKKRFFADFAAADTGKRADLITITSPDTARVDIAAWKKAGLPPEWLFNMSTVESEFSDGKVKFNEYLDTAAAMADECKLKFSAAEFRDFIRNISQKPASPLPHSQSYQQNSASYRIISTRYFNAIEVLQKAAGISGRKHPKIIAVDGRAASGKTTLANQLKMILNAQVIHMDDFFLPPAMRTKMRYEEPGGNVHYERFCEEILPYLRKNQAFSYRIFDCKKNCFNGNRMIWEKSDWIIVEGAYSMHPEFGDYADLKIFFDIDAKEQMRRIDLRNGTKAAHMFQTRWIPLEEKYIRTFRPDRRADIVLR